jgi:ubiquinone/menaquinone biosynthesis C-methylase UbiE
MSSSGWDEMADWWDKQLGDEGDLWHRTLIDPPLLRLVGEVSGMRVLDLACGNGYLSRRFARQGAVVTGVDANAPIIERARAREAQESLGISYHVSDAARLEVLEDGSFDLVVSNMALMDIENAAGAIQEVSRVLRPKGRFVASLSHPCFDKVNTSGWDIEAWKVRGMFEVC